MYFLIFYISLSENKKSMTQHFPHYVPLYRIINSDMMVEASVIK